MPKSFFGANSAAYSRFISSRTTDRTVSIPQFRGGYACCPSHCTFSCFLLVDNESLFMSLVTQQMQPETKAEIIKENKKAEVIYNWPTIHV